MRRDRVALIGGAGVFEDSLAATLASNRSVRVRRFDQDDDVAAFDPDVIVIVGPAEAANEAEEAPQFAEGVAVLRLDPLESTMSFSCRTGRTPASLDSVLAAVRAARALLRGKRMAEGARRDCRGVA